MATNRERSCRRLTSSPARILAVRVLHRVAEHGAYAALALDAGIRRARLDRRDAALCTAIVYGALRVMPELDQAIESRIPGRLSQMDAFTRTVLRASWYQLRHLERVPAHAVVNDAVSLVRSERGRELSGLVNAVLRKLAKERPETPQPPKHQSLPQWVRDALVSALGGERVDAWLSSNALPPPIGLRVNVERLGRAELARRIRDVVPSAEVHLGTISPLSLVLRGAGDPRRLPGFRQGHFAVQDEGAQLVGLCLDVKPGDCVGDACSGRGGKTTLLASMVGPGGRVTAIDVRQKKLDQIGRELHRLGLEHVPVHTACVDLAAGTGELQPVFDKVLVDAPCTGLGTVHRRPELLLRMGPESPGRLSELQLAILRNAIRLVRPGGRLAYAVCSPLPEECIQVTEQLEAECARLERMENSDIPWFPSPDPDGIIRLGPWLTTGSHSAPDVYQVIQWVVS